MPYVRASYAGLTGRQFHRLTVLEEVPTARNSPRRLRCRCTCGVDIETNAQNVFRGLTRSCGSFKIELTVSRTRTHGLTNTPEYRVWAGMKKRCYNPRSKSYRDYGLRGIAVCARWLNDFPAFLADMGSRPSVLHSIDRIDNDGPYAPDNCRWAIKTTQANNTTRNHALTFNGETRTISEWTRRLNFANPLIILKRLQRGWSIERTLTEPLH